MPGCPSLRAGRRVKDRFKYVDKLGEHVQVHTTKLMGAILLGPPESLLVSPMASLTPRFSRTWQQQGWECGRVVLYGMGELKPKWGDRLRGKQREISAKVKKIDIDPARAMVRSFICHRRQNPTIFNPRRSSAAVRRDGSKCGLDSCRFDDGSQ